MVVFLCSNSLKLYLLGVSCEIKPHIKGHCAPFSQAIHIIHAIMQVLGQVVDVDGTYG